ncbi:MAG: Type II secretion system protein E [Candidatus Anoxychlamydiales bacterium]|nr:Type II secretion system protein E [Candidatus Anoxychlamydiales bacterium]NGX36492.1 Type II secretion system protein E [Candidatus Anoxychlamydiales bacterium]
MKTEKKNPLKLHDFDFIKNRIKKIPYLFAKENNLIALEEKNGKILVAISDLHDFEAINELYLMLGADIETLVCKKHEIEQAIEKCYHKTTKKNPLKNENLRIEKVEGYDLLEHSSNNEAVNILNTIILEAITQKASDIHLEPEENILKIRYRIDGILQKKDFIASQHISQIITRIKVMAKLDIAEKRLPQDGRIKLMINKREIDFRLSTVPTVFGERLVLRILDRSNIVLGLDAIGMEKKLLSDFKNAISHTEGIVLVTGPTGSGKTTTLYSAISELNSSALNIMTIEDPVEYKLTNISQMTINPKIDLTFARGLRHILRQDPDIIMIGEIRDRETADIAIQSALTGHLVLSTLHTNDAPSAIIRLADMKIEPYLLSSIIIAVLAQRLVRTICPSCKEEYKPTGFELEQLHLHQKFLYRGKGCSKCFNSGYLGRCGIYEMMLLKDKIKHQIIQDLDIEKLKSSLDTDYQTLLQNGKELVKKGITTSEEVFRVTRHM